MNLQIYDGFKIKFKNIKVLYDTLNEYQKELIPLVQDNINRTYVEKAVYLHDLTEMNSEVLKDNKFLLNAMMDILNRQNDLRSGKSDPEIDHRVEIALIPSSSTEAFGIIYTKQKQYRDLFYSKDCVIEYSYYDNKPNDIKLREWNNRKKKWEQILNGNKENSLVFTAIDLKSVTPHVKNYNDYIPDFHKRCQDAALDGCLQKFVQDKKSQNPNYVPSISTFDTYKTWLNTSDGQAAYEAAYNFCQENLKPVITENDL